MGKGGAPRPGMASWAVLGWGSCFQASTVWLPPLAFKWGGEWLAHHHAPLLANSAPALGLPSQSQQPTASFPWKLQLLLLAVALLSWDLLQPRTEEAGGWAGGAWAWQPRGALFR